MAMNIRPANGTVRPGSAPPQSIPESAHLRRPGEEDLRRKILSSSLLDGSELPDTPPLDLMPQLQRSGPSIVKTRTGSVLQRGFILKTDHYPSGMLESQHSERENRADHRAVQAEPLISTLTCMAHLTSAHPSRATSTYMVSRNRARKAYGLYSPSFGVDRTSLDLLMSCGSARERNH